MPVERRRESVQKHELTSSQLMIWTGQRLQLSEPLYNMVLSFRIRGKIDTNAFCKAFQLLVKNSDALRTTFGSQGDIPFQLIHDSFRYDMRCIEMNKNGMDAWIRDHAERRFNLEKCLFESVLIKLADDDFVWYFNQHHLTTDAWSTSLIFSYMQEYYALAVNNSLGDAVVLPSFRNYVTDEKKKRDSRIMKRAKTYWREQLRFAAEPAEFYRPTPAGRSGRTLRIPCLIGTERSERVRTLSESGQFSALTQNLARFQVFATALFAWLHRLSGNQTIAIGMPNHNRATSQFKKTIGLFIELYPLKVEIDEEETFASLHTKIARNTTELLMNAPSGASSFETSRTYAVVLNYITAEFGNFCEMPVESHWVHANFGDRNHLLRMQIEDFDGDDEFRVYFDLNADTFVGDELEKPSVEYIRILDSLLNNPDQRIDQVDIVSDSERRCLTADSSDGVATYDSTDSVLSMFYATANRSPHSPAVACGSDSLSYESLLYQVERVAARLVSAGVGHGNRVAIAIPRSIDSIVGILSILRCGAAYVPIDASFPGERVANMLQDSDAGWMLTQSELDIAIPRSVKIVFIDSEELSVVQLPNLNDLNLSDSAYVIFTSGSTGRPKGVDVTQRNLSAYVSWACRRYLDGQALDWPLFSSLSFDLTITSIFVPLVSGGQIVIYPELETRREITIRRVIEDNRVDIIKLTPAHLSLIQAMDVSISRLRRLIVGGENLKSELTRSISDYFGGRVEIYNEYGPTECTVGCMIHRYDPTADMDAHVPIGTAIDNAYVYVLNTQQLLQPSGAIGELYVGGTGVARGYANNPDLTVERFVPNPFRNDELMYRTGDLVRRKSDGFLICLGRADDQFKLNGIRIEPGEIENALLQHPKITEAAVQLTQRPGRHEIECEQYCIRCGLSAAHPDAMLNDESICAICCVYEDEAEQAQSYFRTLDDLMDVVANAKAGAKNHQDCMMLLSGGKDSTYALCQLVELGLTPLVFTLDNGFISEGAKANVRRIVDDLGLELIEGSTHAMNQIFVDSLKRFSNVCNGCFKTIYTLSMKIARDRGIRHIFTGLSRGQIFESRVADLFRQRVFDSATIDRTIIDARKAYHRAHDAVSEHLDTSHFDDDAIFEDIQFVDYYRYTDVSLDTMLDYLNESVPWVRPKDTGRSTNCLINEAGIFVHKKERGYHNYSLPYSWDVRLGHKERDAARHELDDDIDTGNVYGILAEIGYTPRETTVADATDVLAAYYVADDMIHADELAGLLVQRLPTSLIPAHFVHLEQLPLTPNGKLDRDALPTPDAARPDTGPNYVPARNPVESVMARIWADILGIERVGIDDNFFDLGGDSIMNIQIVAAATKQGVRLSPQQIFDHATIRELAMVVGTAQEVISQQGPVIGTVPLAPVQLQYLRDDTEDRKLYCQYVLLRSSTPLDLAALQESLRMLGMHHDALRAQFGRTKKGWEQQFLDPDNFQIPIDEVSIDGSSNDDIRHFLDTHVPRLQEKLNLECAPLIRCAACGIGDTDQSLVLILAHHLIIDAVSWWILVEDMDHAYRQLVAGKSIEFPAKTMSLGRWSEVLRTYAQSDAATETLGNWTSNSHADAATLPISDRLSGVNDLTSVDTVTLLIGKHDTRKLLTDAVTMWRIQPQDLLLTSFAKVIGDWSGRSHLLIDMEAHGREPISENVDLLRTVGWFTSIYPVGVEDLDICNDVDSLRQVRRKLRNVPHGGVAFGALREFSESDEIRSKLNDGEKPQLLLNYLGQWRKRASRDNVFEFERPVMAAYSPYGRRKYVFEVNVAVFDGQMQIEWTYSRNLHSRDTVIKLIEAFGASVRHLITKCAVSPDEVFEPDDFPIASLSGTELDDILAEFGEN